MKPFSLEEYLKDPSKKVMTKDGRKVRIICTDRLIEYYPICALVNEGGEEYYKSYTKDGKYYINKVSDSDLFFALEKKEGWINMYKSCDSDRIFGRFIYKNEEKAKNVGQECRDYITTIKIEWEE